MSSPVKHLLQNKIGKLTEKTGYNDDVTIKTVCASMWLSKNIVALEVSRTCYLLWQRMWLALVSINDKNTGIL